MAHTRRPQVSATSATGSHTYSFDAALAINLNSKSDIALTSQTKRQRPPGISRIEAFRPNMQRMAQSRLDARLRSKLDADDIVQEAMLRAYSRFKQLRSPDNPQVIRHWLLRIVVRVLSDQKKRFLTSRRNVNLEYQGNAEGWRTENPQGTRFVSDITPPSRATMRKEESLSAIQRLNGLPPETREVVRSYFLESMTIRQISEATRRTPDSVAGLLRRGVAKLRR